MGLPPLAGFVVKFVLFTASFQASYAWLTVVVLINTVLSLYYYLRVIGPMFLQPPQSAQAPVEGFGNAVALTGALASIILDIGAFFLRACASMASEMSVRWRLAAGNARTTMAAKRPVPAPRSGTLMLASGENGITRMAVP